ncbi:Transcriptional regulatory protein QseB [Frondihabitans sp. 762G35]|uniref:winged helix-turn-helix domain-containing protein n=1 Tax=Frondihabitans sp. 762G35 TaxID=1446794 RepID=UPI000D20B395|nr:response regulator transcription factor [Frondihabitans sp. 762G35]ARC58562.1 Transcriptional regulatory protein QseB [Frondihabitans sp. 762G35]
MRLLLLEDDEVLRDEVAGRLRRAGFGVDEVTTLSDARFQIDVTAYDCLVLDRTVPDGDAVDLVSSLRATGVAAPVLFLTARDSIAERVDGFEHGGDDYLVKPFAFAELVARVRALSSRAARPPTTELTAGDLRLDPLRHQVTRAGVLLSMTPKEFAVLEVLMEEPGAVVSRSRLIDRCWDEVHDPASNVVDVVVWQLRRTLGAPDPVETVRGVGYRVVSALP